MNILTLKFNGVGSKLEGECIRRRELVLGNRFCLERKAGAEHVLDEGWRGHKVLKLEVEDALEPLHGQRAQLRQRAQHAAEVRRAARAGAAAARHVRAQAPDDLHLQLLHPVWLLQPVPFCLTNKQPIN